MTKKRLVEILNNILDWGADHNEEFRKCLINASGLTEGEIKHLGLENYVEENKHKFIEVEDERYQYSIMTNAKWETLDCELTLRELLSVYWNSVRNLKDNEYPILWDIEDAPQEDLDRLVKTKDHYEEDGDGYPIIYYEFID